jgi:type IV pilus assembly protein PilO
MPSLNEMSSGAKMGLAVVVFLLIAAAGIYFMVWPTMQKNEQDQATLQKKLDENNQLRGYVNKKTDIERQIANLKAQMEIQKKIVPEDKDADRFITTLQDTASSAGIQLRSLEAKGTASKDYYTEVPFKIEIDGPYFGVLNFFDRLSRQERIINVDDLQMFTLAGTKGRKQFQYMASESVAVQATAKTFFSKGNGQQPVQTAKK